MLILSKVAVLKILTYNWGGGVDDFFCDSDSNFELRISAQTPTPLRILANKRYDIPKNIIIAPIFFLSLWIAS